MSEKTEGQMENEKLWLHLFELHYTWYEGEHNSTILATTKEQDEVEKDLKEAVSSIKIDREKENAVDCLPEAYRRIIDILRQKGYVVCYFLSDPEYYVREAGLIKRTKFGKYKVEHRIKKTEWKRLR